ncbi:hypothetical protein PCASD_12071 [Puccinia coronata f. sp. avenae]|uniref:Uncharacterized protein n=1 Tax=Puccinia coronata f. sp. avenae TaxID=200324 RepID=A0A2N5RZ25_9BASI|nr:hypothetical protein PCASD_26495 [Puccinia coronata f. sp. avenae]PLW36252.1 hypothetical protein PCASD_12071 [Puccinia coronata f. sp. avenae]
MRIQERWSKCGALWCQLDRPAQLKFHDQAYLATLPNPLLPPTTSNVPDLAGPLTHNEKEEIEPQQKLEKPKTFDISQLANKIFHDLTNLSVAHSIKGYLIVTYPHKKGQAMMTGGSPMGEAFLDMFAIDPNPCGAFLEFVKGQTALKKISGCELPLPKRKRKRKAEMKEDGPRKCNLGDAELNKDSLYKQLGHAICTFVFAH